MAKRRKGLPLHGVVVLDKPQGVTSNAALQKVRWCLNAQKAGHTGALDPLATGVLPLCFGEATKFSQILLESDKEYVTRARLGQTTTTSDAEGEVLEERDVPLELSAVDLEPILERFRGEIDQTPSMYSALKHNGVPLYKLARKGQEIERKARRVRIYELELLEVTLPYISLRVRCSKGTYIRNLVEDIGEVLGCGAHVVELRRTRCGPFDLSHAQSWSLFESGERISGTQLDDIFLPIDTAVLEFPKLILNQMDTGSLIRGQTVKISPPEIPGMAGEADSVKNQTHILRLYRETDGQFLGLGELNPANELKSVRLLNTDVLVPNQV
ncbi:tRNA pseudouridine(55) synthase TruB [Hahella sp. CCB-MM4]|uniref:tRNA pseudouridine(55) synthase TruB n=1 Tax=Hahella sp. (strain CCB-MM4) TaxID=1926491 RepID=UPI000B9AD075|nr:tRNA pseudouridine(55) synthase TruB [Hahella sp. CCB-MM4]OZG71705.1 tRNA pseudouridine(55) synthase TruB [Hahella sp. CCB-MM4]